MLLMCLFSFLIPHFAPLPLFNCIISIAKVRKTLMLFSAFVPAILESLNLQLNALTGHPIPFAHILSFRTMNFPLLFSFFFSSSCFRAHLRLSLYLLSFRSIALQKLPTCVHVSLGLLFSIQLCCCCCLYLFILFFICILFWFPSSPQRLATWSQVFSLLEIEVYFSTYQYIKVYKILSPNFSEGMIFCIV